MQQDKVHEEHFLLRYQESFLNRTRNRLEIDTDSNLSYFIAPLLHSFSLPQERNGVKTRPR